MRLRIYSASGAIKESIEQPYTPSVLSNWNSSADPGDVPDALDQLASRLKTVEAIPPIYPTRATMWHYDANALTGGAFTVFVDNLDMYGYVIYQSTPANGDSFTNSALLRAGTYKFKVLGGTFNTAGKIDWYIDDVLKVSGQDWYSGSTVRNVAFSNTVTITGNGLHKIKGVVNGKNASSGGYQISLVMYALYQTTDISDVQ